MRRVVLVVGPPAAGKSTWVRANAAEGDTVVDFDAIAGELGSPSPHDHPSGVVSRAVKEQARRESQVARMSRGTAYVIRAEPDPAKRDALAEQLRATEVQVVDPGEDVVMARLHARPARSRQAADDWYRHKNSPPHGGRGHQEELPRREPRMTDEAQQQEPESVEDDQQTPEVDGQDFDEQRAKAAINKKNSENAALRKRLREIEEKAAKFDEIEAAKKSEIERISESYEKAQFELKDAQNALVRERIARRHGLPDELADLLPAGDEEQVEAKAKYLATLVNDPVRLPDPSQGSTSTSTSSEDAMARALFGQTS